MNPTAATINFTQFRPLCNETRGHRGVVWNIGYDYEDSEPILEKDSTFNRYWLILFVLIIAGNVAVVIWRCITKEEEQRNSIPSILVMNLAATDVCLGIQQLLYVLMSSDLLCWAWVLPKNVALMTSFCVICKFLEVTYIYGSAMINSTIASYYAAVTFGRFCCIKRFSRRCITIFLFTGWVVVVAIAACITVLLSSHHFGLFYKRTQAANSGANSTDNSTIATVDTRNCLPLLSFAFVKGNATVDRVTVLRQASAPLPIIFYTFFSMVCCLTVTTAGTYLAIVAKLLRFRFRASNASRTNLSTRVGGLSIRLFAIALITLLGWIVTAVLFLNRTLRFELTLPLGFVALSNPLTFTLTSRPFLKAFQNFKHMACFKIGRPIPIEDVINDSESLITSRAPTSETID